MFIKRKHIFNFITNNETFIFYTTQSIIIQVDFKKLDFTFEKCFLYCMN